MSSPARALRSRAWPGGTSPKTVMQMFKGPWVVSPPTSSQPWASARASRPAANASVQAASARGRDRARVKASGRAPQAARSDRFTARDLWPSRRGSTSAKKCRPSTSMSLETASCMPGAGASRAQSSPTPRAARRTGRWKKRRIRSNSPTVAAFGCVWRSGYCAARFVLRRIRWSRPHRADAPAPARGRPGRPATGCAGACAPGTGRAGGRHRPAGASPGQAARSGTAPGPAPR